MDNLSGIHPHDRPVTDNERAWVEIIRLASWDTDPGLTLERVRTLREIFSPHRNPTSRHQQ